MSRTLSVAMAQCNWLVGDIEGNAQRMLDIVSHSEADIVMFSELALSGYSPEDLLLRDDFYQRSEQQLARLQQASQQRAIIVGHAYRDNGICYNALSFFADGELKKRYYKQALPNYSVFDEKRYFQAGSDSAVVEYKGYRLGLLICEDIWSNTAIDTLAEQNIDIVLSINASPFSLEKQAQREALLQTHAKRLSLPIVYLNQVGGQDELVFDGASLVYNAKGEMTQRFASFAPQIDSVTFEDTTPVAGIIDQIKADNDEQAMLSQAYDALVLATADYITKNGFKGAVLGLSGGIDSALTLAIAADAIGADKVQAVMMPFRYTADISIHDAKEEAELLGVEFDIVSIEPMFDAFMTQLAPMFAGTAADTTEENLQARCRGVILMALSNKRRSLVLTTGNKSEVAVGYSTLYGDMAGGFDVLKDVPKTLVFALSKYRNSRSYVIPERVITRPPSAELAPDQRDQDSLPPYDILDAMLQGYVEQDKSVADLVAEGFDEATVRKVIRLVDINEYKRRQGAVGPRITERNFGKDRRYPITNGFGKVNW